ncbi:MAG TPA: DciA family protein [Xanthobacteraceae bacterium]|nr:DciA family protein [Xanthobacteraceae bacterium]
MNKPAKTYPRPVADFVGRCLGDIFARQGFASTELVTHWPEIVGAEIAVYAEPMRLQWPRTNGADGPEPATLVLRVEGPAAIEIQHLAPVIIERVNRYLGWRAVGRLGLRQAPLAPARVRSRPGAPTEAQLAAVEPRVSGIADEDLRAALARLGAALARQ